MIISFFTYQHTMRFISLLFLSLMVFCACERTQFLPSLSDDDGPAITLTSPSTNSSLARPGEKISASIQAVDDLQLTIFRLNLKVLNESGNVVETSTPVQQEIATQSFSYSLNETVSDQAASYQLVYTFEVIDSKGATASVDFSVGVLPPKEIPPFRLLSFSDQRLNSKQANTGFALNFTSRSTYPPPTNTPLNRDIEEDSPSNPNGTFSPQLTSPNNATAGQDSVFVMTDASSFNFDEASWLSLSQAYFSSSDFLNRTPTLSVGDLIIVRLTKAPATQFTMIKITEIVDGAGTANDYMMFDYKVSSE